MPQSLDVRLEQVEQPIGALTAADDGSLRFYYATDYLAKPVRVPISLSLPLQEEALETSLSGRSSVICSPKTTN